MQLSLLNLDQKNARLRKLTHRLPSETLEAFHEQLRQCWVFHDHALEGVVLNHQEMARGLANERGKDVCQDAILHGIHRLYQAIDVVRRDAAAARRDELVDLELLKRMHVLVAPEKDEQAGRYRKVDGPLGAYMHDAPGPKAISYRLRKLVEQLELDLPRLHPVRAAAAIHHQYINIFPFDQLSGRAARLLMNYWLMREGYPPAIIPASARADYFSALCASGPSDLTMLVIEAVETAIDKSLELGQTHQRGRRAEVAA